MVNNIKFGRVSCIMLRLVWHLIFCHNIILPNMCAEAKLHKLLKLNNSAHDWPLARQEWCDQPSVAQLLDRKKICKKFPLLTHAFLLAANL